MFAKNNMKPLWKVKGFKTRTPLQVSDAQIVRYIWVLVVIGVWFLPQCPSGELELNNLIR